jgi:hypothetical protein
MLLECNAPEYWLARCLRDLSGLSGLHQFRVHEGTAQCNDGRGPREVAQYRGIEDDVLRRFRIRDLKSLRGIQAGQPHHDLSLITTFR